MANDNVNKTDFGYEIVWAKTEFYQSKILFFEHIGSKITMSFYKEKMRSWFVNNGQYRVSWINTDTGKYHDTILDEGKVFHIPPLMPASLECLSAGSSLTEVSNYTEENSYNLQGINDGTEI
jgi:hypothetical protein